MKTKMIVALALLVLTTWSFCETARAQEAVNENTIYNVLKSVYPELQIDDIDIKMIKPLVTRTKVNLEIKGKNAILYLKWRRYRNSFRWWFERDAKRSLIILSKTTSFESNVDVHTQSTESKVTDAAEKKKAETVKKEAVEPQPDAQENQETEKAEAATKTTEPEKATAEKAEPAAEPETVEPEKKAEPAAEPEKKAEQPETEKESEPAVAPETGEEPDKTEEIAKPEHPEPGQPAAEPQLAEHPEESTPILPVEFAVGPEAEVTEFLATMVVVVSHGEEESYEKFLLRQDEMTGNVEDEDFRGAVNRWKEQFTKVHEMLANAEHVEIRKINLERPQTQQIERATIQQLSQKIVSVKQVYTGARVDLLLDGKEAYIKVGGLIRTDGGWRIGGLVTLFEPLSSK